MRATDIVVAALISLILYMGLHLVLFFSGADDGVPSVGADVALDQIEKTSKALGEKETPSILNRPSEDGAFPAVRPLPGFEEMRLASEATLIADTLVPMVRRELRVQRRKADVLTIAAGVLAFGPFVLLVVLARVRNAFAGRLGESQEQTTADPEPRASTE